MSNVYSQVKEIDTLGFKVIIQNTKIELSTKPDYVSDMSKFVYTSIMYYYFTAEDKINLKLINSLVKKYYSNEYYQYVDNQVKSSMFTILVIFDNSLKLRQLKFVKPNRGKIMSSQELINAFVDERFLKMYSEMQRELKVPTSVYNKLDPDDFNCYHLFLIPIHHSTFK